MKKLTGINTFEQGVKVSASGKQQVYYASSDDALALISVSPDGKNSVRLTLKINDAGNATFNMQKWVNGVYSGQLLHTL